MNLKFVRGLPLVKWRLVMSLTESRDWCVNYIPKTDFWCHHQKLTLTSSFDFFGQEAIIWKVSGTYMSLTWETRKMFQNAKQLCVKSDYFSKLVICGCIEATGGCDLTWMFLGKFWSQWLKWYYQRVKLSKSFYEFKVIRTFLSLEIFLKYININLQRCSLSLLTKPPK